MKLTTGYDFQGYVITDYKDVIFDEMIVGIGFKKALLSAVDNFISEVGGYEATQMVERLNEVKMKLRNRVIEKAEKKGANALIGIDFESSKIGDLFMVSMTATAVVIEKNNAVEVRNKEIIIEECPREKIDLSFSIDDICTEVSRFESLQEMYDYILSVSEKNPGLFDDEILSSLKESISLGRMYGMESGKDSFNSKLNKYLSTLSKS